MENIVKRLKRFGFQIDKNKKYINGYSFYFKKSFESIDNSKDIYYLTLSEDIKEDIILIYHEYDSILVMMDRETLDYCMDRYFKNSNMYAHLKPSLIERTYNIPKSKIIFFLV